MAITLADAMENAATDVDYAVIDEFRKSDWFIDAVQFDDAATPGTGGGTPSYGYTRLVTERGASVRDYNAESVAAKATRTKQTVDCVPLNGSYELDRALAHLGQRTTDEVAFQSQQALKAVRALFNQSLIDGARQTDANGFDGLDAALAGSDTEVNGGTEGTDVLTVTDWSQAAITDEASAQDAIDALDNLLSLLDGDPTAILTNRQGRLRLRSLARRAGYYERTKDDFGRQVESFAGVPFIDLGAKSGSSSPVIPVESRDIDGAGGGASGTNLTDIYVVRLGLDGLHGVSQAGTPLVQTFLPDFTTAGAVKTGEVEMGPVALALKATKAAAVLRNVKLA